MEAGSCSILSRYQRQPRRRSIEMSLIRVMPSQAAMRFPRPLQVQVGQYSASSAELNLGPDSAALISALLPPYPGFGPAGQKSSHKSERHALKGLARIAEKSANAIGGDEKPGTNWGMTERPHRGQHPPMAGGKAGRRFASFCISTGARPRRFRGSRSEERRVG